MIKKCTKGFTLIEVIIAMSIMGMVTVIIYSLFFSNYKTMNTVNSGVELQTQGEQAMNYIVNTSLSANGINYIIDESGTKFEKFKKADSIPDNIKISKISFKTVKYNKATGILNNNYEVIFSLEKNVEYELSSGEKSYNLEVKETLSAIDGLKVAQFISAIEVKPLFKGKPFSGIINAEIDEENIVTGIEFNIILKKSKLGKTDRAEDLMEKIISNKVKFRN